MMSHLEGADTPGSSTLSALRTLALELHRNDRRANLEEETQKIFQKVP
jgi:hypothetical protein